MIGLRDKLPRDGDNIQIVVVFPEQFDLPLLAQPVSVASRIVRAGVRGVWLLRDSAGWRADVDFEKPLQTIDEDITAFAFAPDGRIVYSVRRNIKTKLYDLQHDDIWLQETNGKKGGCCWAKNSNTETNRSATRWIPFAGRRTGRLILARLFVTAVIDEGGKTQDSYMTVVLDDSGKEVRINGGENVIRDSANAFWLQDKPR